MTDRVDAVIAISIKALKLLKSKRPDDENEMHFEATSNDRKQSIKIDVIYKVYEDEEV